MGRERRVLQQSITSFEYRTTLLDILLQHRPRLGDAKPMQKNLGSRRTSPLVNLDVARHMVPLAIGRPDLYLGKDQIVAARSS